MVITYIINGAISKMTLYKINISLAATGAVSMPSRFGSVPLLLRYNNINNRLEILPCNVQAVVQTHCLESVSHSNATDGTSMGALSVIITKLTLEQHGCISGQLKQAPTQIRSDG